MDKLKVILFGFISLLVILGVVIIFTTNIFNPVKLNFSPISISSVNYNNYVSDNLIDYKDNKLYCLKPNLLSSHLTIIDTNGKTKYINGVDHPFQISNDNIIYISNKNLYERNINTGKTNKISSDAIKFLVYNDLIIYCSKLKWSDRLGKWENSITVFNSTTKEHKVAFENSDKFYIYHDKLYVVDIDDTIIEFSLDGFVSKRLFSIQNQGYGYTILFVKDKLLITYGLQSFFDILDLKTQQCQTIWISDDSPAKINAICNDDSIFVSFQAQNMDGSIITNKKSNSNGLWKINPETLEKHKISSTVYKTLYLFGDNSLFGQQGTNVFKIDIDSGSAQQINLIFNIFNQWNKGNDSVIMA